MRAGNARPSGRDSGESQLCRYLLRPAVSQDRLQLLNDGRVLLALKTAWADGTRHLLFEPLELLEKLAALTPRPRINLVVYHGVLAPNARWPARVVAYGPLPAAASLPRARAGTISPRSRRRAIGRGPGSCSARSSLTSSPAPDVADACA